MADPLDMILGVLGDTNGTLRNAIPLHPVITLATTIRRGDDKEIETKTGHLTDETDTAFYLDGVAHTKRHWSKLLKGRNA